MARRDTHTRSWINTNFEGRDREGKGGALGRRASPPVPALKPTGGAAARGRSSQQTQMFAAWNTFAPSLHSHGVDFIYIFSFLEQAISVNY